MPPFANTRVLLVGRFDGDSNVHNGFRRRAFERLGCALSVLDPGQRGLLERITGADLGERLTKAMEQHRPDVVVVLRGDGLTPQMINAARSKGTARWVNWFPDDSRGLVDLKRIGGVFDHLFVPGSDMPILLGREGARATYLPHACDPSVHKPHRSRGTYRANVVFVGAATPRREQLLTELLEFGVAIWGDGWRRTSLKDYCRGEVPGVEDYVRAYAGASVAINIHHVLDPDPAHDSRACNARLFEVAAIGVAQVVDARGDLPPLFEENSQVLIYQNEAELKGLVKRVLQEDGWRERLANNARQRALREHTYMHRAATLLTTVLRG